MATQQWDFVAIQTFGIGTLTDPIKKMIDAGTPVIAMDTLIAPLGHHRHHHLHRARQRHDGLGGRPRQLMKAIGGKGNVVMTQGALGHSGAQGRAKGFKQVVANYPDVKVVDEQPADWDVTKVARIWDSVLTQNADIAGAFFHNDDMALAAFNVIKAKDRDGIVLGGVDAMPPAVNAVLDGDDADHGAQPVLPHPRLVGGGGRGGGRRRRQGDRGHPRVHPRGRPGDHRRDRAGPVVAAEELPDVIA